MVTLSNIFGPQGATGPQGMTGSTGMQGVTGTTGSIGPMGYVGNMYDLVMERYEKQGLSMKYETEIGIDIKIRDMDDSMIKIEMMTIRTGVKTEVGRAWLDIFTDVIIRRRRLKLEKIKNKMVCQ